MNTNIKFDNSDFSKSLEQVGDEKSGFNGGNPSSLRQYLEIIRNYGYVPKNISESDKIVSENKLQANSNELLSLKNKVNDIKDNLIKKKERDVLDLERGIDNIPKNERFKMAKFLVLILSWLLLTAFLLYFYASISVNAFGKDYVKDPLHLLSIKEIWKTLTSSPGLFLIPTLFFALGVSLHYILDWSNKLKYFAVVVLILFTLILDFVIAIYIHGKVDDYLIMMGKPTSHWSVDIKFWIIIIMGFFIYILWSIVFHGWMEELEKRDVKGLLTKKRNKLNLEISELKTCLSDLDTKIKQLESSNLELKNKLEKKLPTKDDLKRYVSEFGAGWLKGLTYESQIVMRSECEKIIEEIRQNIS